MKTFGLGFLRSISSLRHQLHEKASLLVAYAAMEEALDEIAARESNPKITKFWRTFGPDVRKANALKMDVENLGGCGEEFPAALQYVTVIQNAAKEMQGDDKSTQGDLLLGHAYVRYLADLFGGSMIGEPTKLALRLDEVPTFYQFSSSEIRMNRVAFIERFYEGLNECGTLMNKERRHQCVLEARRAFKCNADVYTERGGLITGALIGIANLGVGYAMKRISKT